MYRFMSSTSSGCDDDPKLNPAVDPNLAKMRCGKVLVCVAEKDWLRDRGVGYYHTIEKVEGKGPAGHLLQKIVDFFALG
ncbi:hypothetical protein M0R45_007851 [Rubus argutus]|uniref:Alpha/beta hydrolase fold-3 domain-containing protein n=1 Tax=Rubus argutus TaxID=59490 RepID=A0AAW1XZK4_RUBAR